MAIYKIRINDTLPRSIEVEGRKVRIPGYEGFAFFIHRSLYPTALSQWTISEVSSGWMVAEGFYQSEVKIKATQCLATVTPEKFQSMIESSMRKAGSP